MQIICPYRALAELQPNSRPFIHSRWWRALDATMTTDKQTRRHSSRLSKPLVEVPEPTAKPLRLVLKTPRRYRPIQPREETDLCPACNVHLRADPGHDVEDCLALLTLPQMDTSPNSLDISSASYGPPQFSQHDVIVVTKKPQLDLSQLTHEQLVQRLRESEVTRCQVCLDRYESPTVSTACWHVFCQQCWLHALAEKKTCPLCTGITLSEDLRRVYL